MIKYIKFIVSLLLIVDISCTNKNEYYGIKIQHEHNFINNHSGYIKYMDSIINFSYSESIDEAFGVSLERYLLLESFSKENIKLLDSLKMFKGNSLSINEDLISSYHYSQLLKKVVLMEKSGDSIVLNIETNLYETVDTIPYNNYKIYFYRIVGHPKKIILARIEKKDSRIGLNLYIESDDSKRKLTREDILSILQL